MGLHQEFISPQELADRHPLIDPNIITRALWDDQDGDLDPSGATYAFAKAAAFMARNISPIRRLPRVQQRPMAVGM